jgi:hypothetical protein
MNKKAILKELIKDPQIKALYNEGFDRSVINKLIIESLMEQDSNEEKVAELKGRIRTARTQWKKMEITYAKYEQIKSEIEKELDILKQPALPAPQPKPAEQIVKTGTNYPRYQLQVVNKLRNIAIANPAVLDLISTLNIEEQQAMINHAVDAVDTASSEEDNKEAAINNINLESLYAYLDKARGKKQPTKNAIVLAHPMVEPTPDDEAEELEPQVVDGDKLIGTIISITQKVLETDEGQAMSAIVVSDEQDEKNKLTAITKLVDEVIKEQPAVKQLGNKTIAQEVVKQIAKSKQPEFIARESFDEAFGPVGDAFDEYEEIFGTTPYLGEQARVLDGLKDALEAFQDKALKTAAKDISGGKRRQEDQPEEINEQEEQVDIPKEAKQKSFTLHKEIIKTTKELVNFIGKVTKDNINTILGKNLRNAARKKASELMNFLLEAREMLASLSKEKGTIEFKENLLREADELSIEELRKRHQQILSNMTKLDRIARTKSAEGEEKKAIDIKYIKPTIMDTLQQIKEMSPSFPSTQRPFGKEGDVGEIKKQVRGIARDVTDIVAKLKGFATTTKERPENIQKLDNYITGAIVILDQYFDLDIDDERLRPYLPPKARPTDAALNKGGADLKAKIEDFIDENGDMMSKAVKKGLPDYLKVKEFINKKLKQEFGNKVPVVIVAKQIPNVEVEHIDEMEVIARFVNFMVKVLDGNEEVSFKESLRDFIKQFKIINKTKLGKELVKQFSREEIREIKDYLSKPNQLQDLVAVVKQQQNISAYQVPTFKGNIDDFDNIINKEVEKVVEDEGIDAEDFSDQEKQEVVQKVMVTPEVQKELEKTNTSEEEAKEKIETEVEEVEKEVQPLPIGDEQVQNNLESLVPTDIFKPKGDVTFDLKKGDKKGSKIKFSKEEEYTVDKIEPYAFEGKRKFKIKVTNEWGKEKTLIIDSETFDNFFEIVPRNYSFEEQIERKLETIIEHYINQRKL